MKPVVPLALALMASAPLASARPEAQEQQRPPEPEVDDRSERLVRDRDRSMMHPEIDPVRIVGNEEYDNDFRSRTPRLGSNTQPPVLIDEDEAYLRRLSMYEEGATFTAALAPAPWSENDFNPHAREGDQGASHPNGKSDVPEEDRFGLLMILLGAGSLVAVALHARS